MATIASVMRVPDYDRLRAVLERAVHVAPEASISVLRAADDSEELLLLVDVGSLERAQHLVTEPRLMRAFFDRAGLEVYPPLFVGELVDTFTGTGTGRAAGGQPPSER